ncbi:MAG TPA: hypothetical protein PKH04_15780 [Burkholderiaceae bacterium]|jgi:hypothetical protein|nr:hypothetical protein [Rhodoferax sp.]HNW03535.1 hypothetical protein [Burkholderiaceae bacterium]
MSPSVLLTIHLFAVAFWLGVVGVEYLLERGRAHSHQHGFNVARLHFQIDTCLEMPTFLVVLATGLALLEPQRMSGLYALKVAAGALAVLGNVLCVVPIVLRKRAAERQDLGAVIRYSRWVDRISATAIPAGLAAFALGWALP